MLNKFGRSWTNDNERIELETALNEVLDRIFATPQGVHRIERFKERVGIVRSGDLLGYYVASYGYVPESFPAFRANTRYPDIVIDIERIEQACQNESYNNLDRVLRGVLAHEFGHVFEKHVAIPRDNYCPGEARDCSNVTIGIMEMEADDRAIAWGFDRELDSADSIRRKIGYIIDGGLYK